MSTIKTPLHATALDYVTQGWRLIPCAPGSKIPLRKDWHKNVMETAEDVDKVFLAYPEANLAICPDDLGLAVLDIDAYKDGFNPQAVEALELPPTYEVRSPRGGRQLYFYGTVPPSVEKLGKGIDTRGRQSYVLIPPSKVEGKQYTHVNNLEIVMLPKRIEEALLPAQIPLSSSVTEQDLPANLSRAIKRLKERAAQSDVAISGQGGNNKTYQVACELIRDLALSPEKAAEIMLEHWNNNCNPPWDTDDIVRICTHAADYGQNEGAFAALPAAQTFADANLEVSETKTLSRFKIYDGRAMMAIAEPKWLVPDLIQENAVGIISAPKGSFKTFLCLDIGLGIASALPSFAGKALSAGPVFYAAHEGFDTLARVHYPAWCQAKRLDPRADNGFYMLRGPRLGHERDVQDFGDAIQRQADTIGRSPKLIILDTYSRCMVGLQENDPSDAARFVDFCYSLVDAWPGSAVISAAHKGKDPTRGTRGSSGLEAACDFVLDLERKPTSNLVMVKVKFQRGGKEREAPWHLLGEPMHNSLVFKAIAGAEVSGMQRVLDILDYRNIANILRQMGATQNRIAVTSEALAMTLTVREPNESQEVYDAKCKAQEQILRRLAKSSLKALCFGEGRNLRWMIGTVTV